MPSIRIKKTPLGFAPERIRSQWVGVEIPLVTEAELQRNPPSRMRIGNENADGYLVLRAEAINALRRAEAAIFWEKLSLGVYLQFKKDVCEVIP